MPIAELPDYYRQIGASRGSTDVILITDAECRIPRFMQESFNQWKMEVPARVITLTIQNEPGDLRRRYVMRFILSSRSARRVLPWAEF